MNTIKKLQRCDGVSAILALASVLLLVASTWAIARPTSAAVSDHLLDRIHGTIPNFNKDYVDNCTDENLIALNAFNPPGAPPFAVSFSDCVHGLNTTTICIACNLTGGKNYALNNVVQAPGVWAGNSEAIDCGYQNGGTEGHCVLDSKGNPTCQTDGGFDGATFVIDYPSQ